MPFTISDLSSFLMQLSCETKTCEKTWTCCKDSSGAGPEITCFRSFRPRSAFHCSLTRPVVAVSQFHFRDLHVFLAPCSFLLIRYFPLITITPFDFTPCSSSPPLWLLLSRGHRPTLDPSHRRKPLETSYLSAQSFHLLHRPTLADWLPSLSSCPLLFCFTTSQPRCSVSHPSTSQVQCHLQVAAFTSAERCACRRICGRVCIVVRHRF
jgi:hypothetical protein